VSTICSRHVSASGTLARATAVGVMSSVALVAVATTTAAAATAASAATAADATATAMESSNPAGFHLFGMPIATAVWLLAGVLAVVVGLLGASRSARANAGAPGRLVTAGVDNTAFGADALATKGDVGSDRS